MDVDVTDKVTEEEIKPVGEAKRKSPWVLRLLILFVVAGVVGGAWWWYQTTRYVSTDDARIAGTMVNVSAKLPGRVVEVLIKEGDTVKAGQVLARIDTREVAAQRAQAEANLATAKAKYEEAVHGSRPQEIRQAGANVEQLRAAAEQARVNAANAARTYQRMKKLYNDGAISSLQWDNVEAAYRVAQESVQGADNGVAAAQEKMNLLVAGSRDEVILAAAAQVKLAEGALQSVNVSEENSIVVAPVDGSISLKSVNPGEVVASGQSLFTLTDLKDVWVNARIEETKIGKIKVGNLVEYTIDGYPGKEFSGKIYDVGTATSSTFALIPTENASGNFTKVTQRIPIKISLPQDAGLLFRPGMSVLVKIHVSE